MDSEMLEHIRETANPGMDLGLYWLENRFGQEAFRYPCKDEIFEPERDMVSETGMGNVLRCL